MLEEIEHILIEPITGEEIILKSAIDAMLLGVHMTRQHGNGFVSQHVVNGEVKSSFVFKETDKLLIKIGNDEFERPKIGGMNKVVKAANCPDNIWISTVVENAPDNLVPAKGKYGDYPIPYNKYRGKMNFLGKLIVKLKMIRKKAQAEGNASFLNLGSPELVEREYRTPTEKDEKKYNTIYKFEQKRDGKLLDSFTGTIGDLALYMVGKRELVCTWAVNREKLEGKGIMDWNKISNTEYANVEYTKEQSRLMKQGKIWSQEYFEACGNTELRKRLKEDNISVTQYCLRQRGIPLEPKKEKSFLEKLISFFIAPAV